MSVATMVKETIAERITKLREQKGLTKYRLAKLSGIRIAYLYQLESGKVTNPRMDTLIALAKGLEVSVSVLIGERVTDGIKQMLPCLVKKVIEEYEAKQDGA